MLNYIVNRFKYRAAVLWNGLPQDIKNAPNIDEFKYLYKKHFFDKCCDRTWIVCVYTYRQVSNISRT